MAFKEDDICYRPQDVLRHGQLLLESAREEYLDMQSQGYDEDESYWSAFEGVCANNFDTLAIIWAAGAVSLALNSEDVSKAIEESICSG